MADQNQHKLLNLYRAAVDELKPDRIWRFCPLRMEAT